MSSKIVDAPGLAEKVRALRNQGKTQEQIAVELRIAQSTVSVILRSNLRPPPFRAAALRAGGRAALAAPSHRKARGGRQERPLGGRERGYAPEERVRSFRQPTLLLRACDSAFRSKPRYARTAFSIYDKLENLFDATHRCVALLFLPVLDWYRMDDEALGRPLERTVHAGERDAVQNARDKHHDLYQRT